LKNSKNLEKSSGAGARFFDKKGYYIGPSIVIVGATASGKTSTAVELALRLPRVLGRPEALGEVISADSRAIYKYMDIGTAKPSILERKGVPHFGLDLVEPSERFTVADFKEYAVSKISEIRSRGHIPIIAGGTGLYVDALIYDYKFDNLSKDIKHGTPEGNKEAVLTKDRAKVLDEFKVFGISWSAEELRERIELRERQMYCPELFSETKFLIKKYGWGSQAMKSNIYQFVDKYLRGELTLDEAIEQNVYDDWHLAKRQMTWFKRNKEIKWCSKERIEEEILKIFA